MNAISFASDITQSATPASGTSLRLAAPFVGTGEDRPDRRKPDPAGHAGILEKHDDRLIRDIGLTREEILGPERSFWRDWLAIKTPWQL